MDGAVEWSKQPSVSPLFTHCHHDHFNIHHEFDRLSHLADARAPVSSSITSAPVAMDDNTSYLDHEFTTLLSVPVHQNLLMTKAKTHY